MIYMIRIMVCWVFEFETKVSKLVKLLYFVNQISEKLIKIGDVFAKSRVKDERIPYLLE